MRDGPGTRYSRGEVRRILLALRAEMLDYLEVEAVDISCCPRCLLPLPEGDFESYSFCPWCSRAFSTRAACFHESRRIIQNEWGRQVEVQCGECGCEYAQPQRYPFRYCVVCGARFAAEDEAVIVLPFRV